MNRSRWQVIGVWIAVVLGVAVLVLALWLMTQDAGPGEVSVVLHGAAIVFGLTLSVVCAGIAFWVWFWQVRVVRWAGLCCVAVVALWSVFTYATQKQQEWSYQREVEAAEREADLIGDRYLSRLIAEQPVTAYLSRILFEEFYEEHRRVPSPSGSAVSAGREFRAVWFLYYWTFFDPEFDGFTTYYPRESDCALFLEAFGAKYSEVAPVQAFIELCETP